MVSARHLNVLLDRSRTSIASLPTMTVSPAPPLFRTLVFTPQKHTLPPSHISDFCALINPAYAATGLGYFPGKRIPDSTAKELIQPGRWVLGLYVASPSSPPLELTDSNGVRHDMEGWELVGTLSLSREAPGSAEVGSLLEGVEVPTAALLEDDAEFEYHVHLFAVSLAMSKSGLGSKLLTAAEEWVRKRHVGERTAFVANSIVEFHTFEYYKRRGFVQDGEMTAMPLGTWGSCRPFRLARMVKWLE